MNAAYYNENDAEKAAVIRELIRANVVAPGDVDERSITDVSADDVRGYTQCHWFAGFGVWSYALRLAGWADDRAVWTGSCPCQPFSSAGKRDGFTDERHLWPEWFRLINACRPPVIFGEQVSSSINGTASENASVQTLQGRETILRVLRELQGKPSEYMQGMYERTGARIQAQSSGESGEELSGVARQEARACAGECGPVSSEEERAALHPGPRGHSGENRPWSLRSHGNPVRSYQASLMELTISGQDRFNEGIHAGERESDSLFLECDGERLGHPESSGSGQCDPRAAYQAQRRIDRIFGRCFEGESLWSWLDLISANLEETGYTRWPVVLGAHSAGAPHRRQRLFFCADTEHAGFDRQKRAEAVTDCDQPEVRIPDGDRAAGECADTELSDWRPELQEHGDTHGRDGLGRSSDAGQLSDTESERLREAGPSSGRSPERAGGHGEPIISGDSKLSSTTRQRTDGGQRPDSERLRLGLGSTSEFGDIGDTSAPRLSHSEPEDLPGARRQAERRAATEPGQTFGERIWRGPGWLDPNVAQAASETGATRGFWADCDWWYGRDGKYRPIEPGIFPLAHGVANRVLKLRGYGDAINAEVAKAFIAAYMEATEDGD